MDQSSLFESFTWTMDVLDHAVKLPGYNRLTQNLPTKPFMDLLEHVNLLHKADAYDAAKNESDRLYMTNNHLLSRSVTRMLSAYIIQKRKGDFMRSHVNAPIYCVEDPKASVVFMVRHRPTARCRAYICSNLRAAEFMCWLFALENWPKFKVCEDKDRDFLKPRRCVRKFLDDNRDFQFWLVSVRGTRSGYTQAYLSSLLPEILSQRVTVPNIEPELEGVEA